VEVRVGVPTAKRRLNERGTTSRIVHIRDNSENFQLRRRVLLRY
jgi:hypothetical protein